MSVLVCTHLHSIVRATNEHARRSHTHTQRLTPLEIIGAFLRCECRRSCESVWPARARTPGPSCNKFRLQALRCDACVHSILSTRNRLTVRETTVAHNISPFRAHKFAHTRTACHMDSTRTMQFGERAQLKSHAAYAPMRFINYVAMRTCVSV